MVYLENICPVVYFGKIFVQLFIFDKIFVQWFIWKTIYPVVFFGIIFVQLFILERYLPSALFGKIFVQLFILVFAKLETDGLGLSWPLLKVGTKPDGLSISFHSTFLLVFLVICKQ